MSVQKWVREEDAKPSEQAPEIVTTRRVLASFLEGSLPASDAASSILTIYREIWVTWWGSKPLEKFWALFSSLSCSVGGDPVLAERMVDLLLTISRLPAPVNPANGKASWPDTERGWIRGFGFQFREYGTCE